MGGFDTDRSSDSISSGDERELLLAAFSWLGGRLWVGGCVLYPLMRKGTILPPFLSFSNLGTIEVRFQVGIDSPHPQTLGIAPRASHMLGVLSTPELYFHPK